MNRSATSTIGDGRLAGLAAMNARFRALRDERASDWIELRSSFTFHLGERKQQRHSGVDI